MGFGEEQMETKYIPMMLFSVGSRRWMWSIKDGKNWMNIERTDRLKMYKMTQILFGTRRHVRDHPISVSVCSCINLVTYTMHHIVTIAIVHVAGICCG